MSGSSFRLSTDLLDAIQRLVEDVPLVVVNALAEAVGSCLPADWICIHAAAQGVVAHPHYRERVGNLVEVWRRTAPEYEPPTVALALAAAVQCGSDRQASGATELVWTGPHQGTLRRTDQALLEVINRAQRDLLIVTFAAYKVAGVREALGRALQRGVRIRLVIESQQESDGKVAYDGLTALGGEVAQHAHVYCWPLNARPIDEVGRHGSLHAKCAVADERLLFISSANLTAYAFTLNLEMGLLIEGDLLPRQVAEQFNQLIGDGVLVRS